MGNFFERKLGLQGQPPPAAPAQTVYPGTAPYTPAVPAPAAPVVVPAAPAAAPAQTFTSDEQGVKQLVAALPKNVNPGIILAENWQGGEGAAETRTIGQCPKCASPRFSAHGDRVFNTETKMFATPAQRCNDCGYNSAGYEQNWASPKRMA